MKCDNFRRSALNLQRRRPRLEFLEKRFLLNGQPISLGLVNEDPWSSSSWPISQSYQGNQVSEAVPYGPAANTGGSPDDAEGASNQSLTKDSLADGSALGSSESGFPAFPALNVLHAGNHPDSPGCCCALCNSAILWDSLQEGAWEDEAWSSTTGSGSTSGSPLGTPADLSDTFQLHSNPGANHTIYLDFDGHVTEGTIWNSFYSGGEPIVTPAYNFEGSPDTFTDAELERIQWIWARVAEDFLPFDVNVTTEDPGSAALRRGNGDTEWGVRVVIGGSSFDWRGVAAGGVAFVGSFNWNTDTPVFVFPAQLGNGNEKFVAGAISHEVGHALGLQHHGRTSPSEEYYAGHGSGETGWAPIMGNPYHRNLTTWSRGEYANANRPNQDDITIITTQNGFGFRADDHGNDQYTATPLTPVDGILSAQGIIVNRDDVDVFSFTADAGQVEILASPAWRGPNLDILLELLDSSYTVIASSNPVAQLSASIVIDVQPGQYFIRVSGTGMGDPLTNGYSDYGSLGQYFIDATVPIEKFTSPDYLSIAALDADKPVTESLAIFRFEVHREGENLARYSTVQYIVSGYGDFPAEPSNFFGGKYPAGAITFTPGQTSYVLEVPVTGDALVHPQESFVVTLHSAVEPTVISVGSAVGVIQNTFSTPFRFEIRAVDQQFYGVSGQQRLFTVDFDNESFQQDTSLQFQVDWGDGSPQQTWTGNSGLVLSHAFAQPGDYQVTVVTSVDEEPVYSSLAVNILPWELQGDVMVIGGTLSNDNFYVATDRANRPIRVWRDGDSSIEFRAPRQGIQFFGAGGDNSVTVLGTDRADSFTIDRDSIVVNGLTVRGNDVQQWSVDGLAGNDTFYYLAGVVHLNGGDGNNELVGPNQPNRWWIDGNNSGRIESASFSSMANLQGGADRDWFQFSPDGSINGNLNGGGGLDALDYSSWSQSVSVNFGNGNVTAVGGRAQGFQIAIGGSGDDTLVSGRVASLLVGGGGNDTLIGGRSDDILIAGFGSNYLDGGAGSDLLIGGRTIHDNNAFALADLLQEWSSGRSYQQRIDNLLGLGQGPRLNGNTFLGPVISDSVFADEGAVNELIGGNGQDWFIASLFDHLPDRLSGGSSSERLDWI